MSVNPSTGVGSTQPISEQHTVRRVRRPSRIYPSKLPQGIDRPINAQATPPPVARPTAEASKLVFGNRTIDDDLHFFRLKNQEMDEEINKVAGNMRQILISNKTLDLQSVNNEMKKICATYQAREGSLSDQEKKSYLVLTEGWYEHKKVLLESLQADFKQGASVSEASKSPQFKRMAEILKLEGKSNRTIDDELRLIELKNESVSQELGKIAQNMRQIPFNMDQIPDNQRGVPFEAKYFSTGTTKLQSSIAQMEEAENNVDKEVLLERAKVLLETKKALLESLQADFKKGVQDKQIQELDKEIGKLEKIPRRTRFQQFHMLRLKNMSIHYKFHALPLAEREYSPSLRKRISQHNAYLKDSKLMDPKAFSKLNTNEQDSEIAYLDEMLKLREGLYAKKMDQIQKTASMHEVEAIVNALGAKAEPLTSEEQRRFLHNRNARLEMEYNINALPWEQYSSDTIAIIGRHNDLVRSRKILTPEEFAALNDNEKEGYLNFHRALYDKRLAIKGLVDRDVARFHEISNIREDIRYIERIKNQTTNHKIHLTRLKMRLLDFDEERLGAFFIRKPEMYTETIKQLIDQYIKLNRARMRLIPSLDGTAESQSQYLVSAEKALKARKEMLVVMDKRVREKQEEVRFQQIEAEIDRLSRLNPTGDQLIEMRRLQGALLGHRIAQISLNEANASKKTNDLFKRDIGLSKEINKFSHDISKMSAEEKRDYLYYLEKAVDCREVLFKSLIDDRTLLESLEELRSKHAEIDAEIRKVQEGLAQYSDESHQIKDLVRDKYEEGKIWINTPHGELNSKDRSDFKEFLQEYY
jgi:hypothetical protein